jgi:hypothetical protein
MKIDDDGKIGKLNIVLVDAFLHNPRKIVKLALSMRYCDQSNGKEYAHVCVFVCWMKI